MAKKKKDPILEVRNTKALTGYDYKLGMSIKYLCCYLEGYRNVDYIEKLDHEIKDYIYYFKSFQMHHRTKDKQIINEPLYPTKQLLLQYLKEEIPKILDKERKLNKTKYIRYELCKINKQIKSMKEKYKRIYENRINSLVLRIPHLSPSVDKFDEMKSSFCIDKRTFITLSNFNSDPLLDKLVNGKRFSFFASNKYSRLFFDLERLIGNDAKEEKDGFSFLPQYAISPYEEHKVRIRKFKYAYQDPNYFKILRQWIDFNHQFECAVQNEAMKTKNNLFIISLHSFDESYIIKKFPHFKNRNFPDINITFSSNFNDELKKKIKRKIHYLNHLYHFKVSFKFPYADSYHILNRRKNNIYSMTIELNKKIYLENFIFPSCKTELYNLRKYLDEFFVYLLNIK